MKNWTFLLLIILLFTFILVQNDQSRREYNLLSRQFQDSLVSLREQVISQDNKLALQMSLAFYDLPHTISFCDSIFRLENTILGMRVNAELFNLLQKRGSLIILWQRMGTFFPLIEKELVKQAVPDDIKIMVAIESWLDSKAGSYKGARGLMQLMNFRDVIGKLRVNQFVDERLDPIKAIPQGIKYLKYCYKEYQNWLLAIAAYNMGPGALKQQIVSQGVSDYQYLRLSRETEKHLPMILALKIILSDPEKYIPGITRVKQFAPYPNINTKTVRLLKSSSLRDLTREAKISWNDFYKYNQQYRGNSLLPPGNYQVNIPQ